MSAHPEVNNSTPFEFATHCMTDHEGLPIMVVMLKATFKFNLLGHIGISSAQSAPCAAGIPWGDDPETSSYQLEPETAFYKPKLDVVINGYLPAQHQQQTHARVGFQFRDRAKVIDVYGDRVWEQTRFGVTASSPQLIGHVGLHHEFAYGGVDRRHPDEAKHATFLANPVGKGYVDGGIACSPNLSLPNLCFQNDPITTYGQHAQPASFGFTSPNWLPRRNYGGTFDKNWAAKRSPRLPEDFSFAYFNSAPLDQQFDEYIQGQETLTLAGLTLEPKLQLQLPVVGEISCELSRRSGASEKLIMKGDTLIIDTDASTISVIWRATSRIQRDPLEIRNYEISISKPFKDWLAMASRG